MFNEPQLSGSNETSITTGMLLLKKMAGAKSAGQVLSAAHELSSGEMRGESPVGGRRVVVGHGKRVIPGSRALAMAEGDLSMGEVNVRAAKGVREGLRSRLTLDFSKLVSRDKRNRPLRHLGHELTRNIDYNPATARDTQSTRARGFHFGSQTSRAQRASALRGRYMDFETVFSPQFDAAIPSPSPVPSSPQILEQARQQMQQQQQQPGGVTMENTLTREARAKASARDGTGRERDIPWRDGYAVQPHTPSLRFERVSGRTHRSRGLEKGQEGFYTEGADSTFDDQTRHVKGAVEFCRSTSRSAQHSGRSTSIGKARNIDFGVRPSSAPLTGR
eukprot:Hpha_TRINITY_DN15123_c4_g1::TRINITY_DN15123_c4_g1_i1::g.127417::m.127417